MSGTPAFRTLAAFIRALEPGSVWQMRSHWQLPARPPYQLDQTDTTAWSYRQVAVRQTNAVAFATRPEPAITKPDELNRGRYSWLWFPKAARCSFPEPGVVRIGYDHGGDWLEYRRWPDDQPLPRDGDERKRGGGEG